MHGKSWQSLENAQKQDLQWPSWFPDLIYMTSDRFTAEVSVSMLGRAIEGQNIREPNWQDSEGSLKVEGESYKSKRFVLLGLSKHFPLRSSLNPM